MLMTRIRTTLKFFIIWRIISICVVQTYYVPDEYWQSLEIAHQMVFGYGYETWEWHLKIRSYVYPFLISITYKLLAILHLDYATLLIYIPRVAQAIVSGYADYKFFTWTKSDLAIVLLEFNWFCYFYGEFTFTPWEFFKVNVLNNIANHYGTHNLFWYLTTGLPVVIGLPILYFPIAALHVIKHCQFLSAQTISLITITWTLGYVIDNPSEADVLFLMPCHSTPFYSHLHLNISMRFLSCEPNLKNQPNYLDEADHFFNNPTRWIDNNYNNCTLPMILMTYDNIVPLIETFLKNYQPALVLFNTHFPQSNIEEKVKTTIEMECLLKDGHLELAKARYIRGKESVGIYRIPQESQIHSLFDLETTFDENKFQSGIVPHFDISLKSKEHDNEIQNPIKWFGVLVPQNLKIAQKKFQESIYLVTKIANISAELETISKQYQNMKNLTNKVKHDPEE
ncbi:hypothetical protein PV326_004054 [Microctonus aethiopoides]|nr:hypothetical protein PV326_004054 [Microctonus aethiopoides]